MSFSRIISILILSLLVSCGAPISNEAPPSQSEPVTAKKNEDPKPEPKPSPGATAETEKTLTEKYGCPLEFDGIDLCARIEWVDNKGEIAKGPIYFDSEEEITMVARLQFWKKTEGKALNPRIEFEEVKFVNLKLFMPSHGHGSNVPTPDWKASEGLFLIKNILFSMPSSARHPWHVKVQLKKADFEEDYSNATDANIWKQVDLSFSGIERRKN